jgi:undecaprenyl diphosphate synthase
MDGNGRWAQKKGLPRAAGHRAGMETLKRVVESAINIGITHLTVYAFSTENWKRPQEEIDALMNLLVEYVEKELQQLKKNGVKVKTLGSLEQLPAGARRQIEKAIAETNNNSKLNLQIALNYGGRKEIVDAVRILCQDVKEGKVEPENINEAMFSNYLYTAGMPDPDLIIRPSGEMRLSNFLLWQSAYAEYWTTPVLWPDFSERDLFQAIRDYQGRQRRYGGL